MTVTSTFPAPSFSVDFWQPYIPVTGADHAVEAVEASGTPALSYSAGLHGSHADFCRSEHFVRYKEEVRASLSFLVEFCRQYAVPDVHEIAENFNTFFSHRFDDHHYFDTRAEMVDSIGKRSLDEFCSMIRNEAVDTDKRKTAIRDLSYGITLCADGAVSNLVSAACALGKAIGGIRGKLWELKAQTATHVLRQLIDQQFSHANNYLGNEIHYVNTALNMLADQFGLEKPADGITMSEVAKDTDLLATCAATISAALTPDRLSLLIAEACQARLNSRLGLDAESSSGVWNAGTERSFSETLEEIGNEFGLTSSDSLELDGGTETVVLRASDLRMKSFVELREVVIREAEPVDDPRASNANDQPPDAEADTAACTYTYTVRADPSLIALDVLRAMDGLKLLQAQICPQNSGEWVDENGMRAALFVYGELAWVVRIPAGEEYDTPVWRSRNAEFELITVPDLLRWKGVQANTDQSAPAAAIRQAIQVTAIEQLGRMPARWLGNAEDLLRLLRRLGANEARDYLAENLSILGPMGAKFTNQERTDLLARILRIGTGNSVRVLAERWVPKESTRVDMIHAVLLREAIPAFHEAMLEAAPQTAVQAWYQPLRESGLLILVAPRLADLLDTWYTQSSILAHVLNSGEAAAVEAFFTLVKDLLKNPTIRWYIKDELPGLLAATDCYDIPALSNAMADGRAAAVLAYYTGLKDLLTDPALALTIRPTLLEALPDLLLGKKGTGDSGLGFAIENGHTGIITTFNDILNELLNEPDIAPHVQRALPRLLAAKFGRGASALSQAMRHRGTAAIKAFYAMLTDPAIMPHIQYAMPTLLNGLDTFGKTGLSNALEHGHASTIEAYHHLLKRLLNEPAVAPQIRRMMPHLMDTKNRDGTSGYLSAMRNGHTAAVQAYCAMQDDPAIRPYLGEDRAARLWSDSAVA